jgi:hypothetical protein
MTRITKNSWKTEEEDLLRTLAAKGATVMRASAALNRPSGVVSKKARDMGLALVGVRQIRAAMRAAEPK